MAVTPVGTNHIITADTVGGTSAAAVLPSTVAASGNKVITWVVIDKGITVSSLTAPTGFTIVEESNSASVSYGLAVSDGDESGNDTFTWTWGLGRANVVGAKEYEGAATISVDVSSGNNTESNGSSLSTGTTATTASTSSIALAFWGNDSSTNVGTPSGFTNSFIDLVNSNTSDATPACYVSTKAITGGSTVETTFSYTGGSADQMCAAVVILDDGTGGGGLSIPVAINSYRQRRG